MCRIMYLEGDNSSRARSYLEEFFKLGSDDSYLQRVAENFEIPGVGKSHNHGWGYIYVEKDMIHHYKQGRYFADDLTGQKTLFELIDSAQSQFIVMIELRVTDLGYVSAFNAHPFHFISRNGYEGYLFYNGLLDYEKLAQIEGINFSDYHSKNGTTLMGISIANALERGENIIDAIEVPKKALKSAYNLMLFYRDNSGHYHSLLHSYIHSPLLELGYVKDHNTLIYSEQENLFCMTSFALKDRISGEFTEMSNGQTLHRHHSFIEEYYFDGYARN